MLDACTLFPGLRSISAFHLIASVNIFNYKPVSNYVVHLSFRKAWCCVHRVQPLVVVFVFN